MPALTHIAGPDLHVDTQLRQRCCWCGAVLIDYDLTRVAVFVGEDHDPSKPVPPPATWPVGALVLVDGNASSVVDPGGHEEGWLPPDACARLDHEVTA